MKKIIVATDFSIEADNAMEYAAKFAAEHQYEIVLFSLHNTSIHAQNARLSGTAMNSLLDHKHELLQKIACGLSQKYKITVNSYFASGDFYEQLLKAITETDADILVMGMPPKTLDLELLGNTTTKALDLIKIPILTVPVEAKYHGIQNILFACDMMKGLHRLILQSVRNTIEDLGSKLEVFHVSTRSEELIEETKAIDEILEGTDYFYRNIESKKIIESIEAEVNNINADLLIMAPHRYTFWESIIHKSKTKTMVAESKIPLLSLNL